MSYHYISAFILSEALFFIYKDTKKNVPKLILSPY